MKLAASRTIVLREHEEIRFPPGFLDSATAEAFRVRSGESVEVLEPSRRTGGMWSLRPGSVVGAFRLDDGTAVRIDPKVGIANIFRMLEYAYDLEQVRFPGELVEAATLADLFERFAILLSNRVLRRAARGFVREYQTRGDELVTLRGRIRFAERARRPHVVALRCDFEEHTGDSEDNRILSWALYVVSRSPWCGERSRPHVRRALHAIAGIAPPAAVRADACDGRIYDRLNADYEPMHALARFFLRNCGPAHAHGVVASFPFLVDMNALFERFVERWLERHVPASVELKAQHHHRMSANGKVSFRMDIVLTDRTTGGVLCVLDSKYKRSFDPDTADVQQVIAYAEELGCRDALLVYPTNRIGSHDHVGRTIRVRSCSFDLEGDLEAAGARLLRSVLGPPRV